MVIETLKITIFFLLIQKKYQRQSLYFPVVSTSIPSAFRPKNFVRKKQNHVRI